MMQEPPQQEGATRVPRDLSTREEIGTLVRTFYARVAEDDLLGPVFVDQAQIDWDEHMPRLIGFWCQLELGLPGSVVRPTQKHSALSSVEPFRAEQFARWVALFHTTIDGGWSGPHAESMKARAVMIARAQSTVVIGAEPWQG